jgi:hypothetical protein
LKEWQINFMVFNDFFDWLESDAGEAASQAIDDI